MDIQVAGENALILYFGSAPGPEVSDRVQAATLAAQQALGSDLIDLIPSYASLLVLFDPLRCDAFSVRQRLRAALADSTTAESDEGRTVVLPAYYATESGPDLARLAEHAGLSVDEVIEIHSQTAYRVYAIGFAPGFAYLGEVDPRIAAPRLDTPRKRVPRGAVAIADRQTAVYPAVSPGGWNLIGLCPTRLFDPHAEPTMPVSVGDTVRFEPVSRERFLELGGELGEEAR